MMNLPALTVIGLLMIASVAASADQRAVAAATAAPIAAPPVPPAGSPGTDSAYAAVTPGRSLVFPLDYGSHPDFRTEWWYVTGWLKTRAGEDLGFQITFFRTKPAHGDANPSAFAPRQLLIAHCAISDARHGHLWQDQRIRRAGLGLAEARSGDTDVWIDDWSLKRGESAYTTTIVAADFSLALRLSPSQPALLNGTSGVSRKGPAAHSASYYYSLPHLQVTGSIKRGGTGDVVTGEAWFDHEWSSEYLDADSVGWDWIGINLDDGGALMAFRIRGRDHAARWAGGTLRTANGDTRALEPADVSFTAVRTWKSSRTGIVYPVEWRVRAGGREFELRPLMDDQENDTRLSTGAIYWEGAVTATEQGRPSGRGYLELTGYGERLQLR